MTGKGERPVRGKLLEILEREPTTWFPNCDLALALYGNTYGLELDRIHSLVYLLRREGVNIETQRTGGGRSATRSYRIVPRKVDDGQSNTPDQSQHPL